MRKLIESLEEGRVPLTTEASKKLLARLSGSVGATLANVEKLANEFYKFPSGKVFDVRERRHFDEIYEMVGEAVNSLENVTKLLKEMSADLGKR